MGCDEGMDTKEIGNKGCTDQEKREWEKRDRGQTDRGQSDQRQSDWGE